MSCQLCNLRHKANHLFIDPAAEDREVVVGFREHVPVALGGDVRAERTIRRLGLRRPELNERREAHLALVTRIYMLAIGHPDTSLKTEALVSLRELASPKAEYSLMVRTYLRAHGMSV